MDAHRPKPILAVPISPPPVKQRVDRNAAFATPGEKKNRYSLPDSLGSASPIGYRTRMSFTKEEAQQALDLLSMERPTGFKAPIEIQEQALFEECSLGVLSARQSTNYRGYKQFSFGPKDSQTLAQLMRAFDTKEASVLDNASMTHVVLDRPYRTPFTMLLTLVGHRPLASLLTVPLRAWRKKVHHQDDIPTIGYLPDIHVGILADAQERAAVIASGGTRRAQVFMKPFSSPKTSKSALKALETFIGLTGAEKRAGWRIALVTQVGVAIDAERIAIPDATLRKIGANLLAFRSERIQPGVNQEQKAPPQYQTRQDMDVPSELVVMAGRAGYNSFSHWTGCDRERAKELLLLERIDVLTPNGKTRLRQVRAQLSSITDRVVKTIPLWADLPVGKAFSRNAERGRKAFALAGQRVYISGLSRTEVESEGLAWRHAIRALGAAAARTSLVAEIMGATEIPEQCDLLAGICMMAGPVNQNDIGKSFYGYPDLLDEAFSGRNPTSLLVWTLKAKTVADPIGNEEQLLNSERKGALVDLRPGPHEVVHIVQENARLPMRQNDGVHNEERAFSDQKNFVSGQDGTAIPGNNGTSWPSALSEDVLWTI